MALEGTSPGGVRRRDGTLETGVTLRKKRELADREKKLSRTLGRNVHIETIGGKEVAVEVKQPDQFEARTQSGELVAKGSRADLTKQLAIRQREEQEAEKKRRAVLSVGPTIERAEQFRKSKALDDFYKTYDDVKEKKTSLGVYAEKLVTREKRLEKFKSKVFEKLRLTAKEDAKFYNVLEIGKGVARVPFELATLPTIIYGRGQLAVRSVFDKAGREELKASVSETPGAVREVFVSKDLETGKYRLTPQNIVNIGLIGLSARSVAKSPSNVGLKTFEKYAKTNIKGTVKGFQGTTVFKSVGKFKGRPYKELTVTKGKTSTSVIDYQGKQFTINRIGESKGTFKITTTKTKLKIDRNGLIPKKVRLEKEVVVLKKGKITGKDTPLEFKVGEGITKQDITLLDERALSKTYIRYLEELKTQAKANQVIKSGGQKLKFESDLGVRVKADVKGVVTSQRTAIKEVSFKDAQTKLTLEKTRPKIEFAKNPVNTKDVVFKEYIKEGKFITGAKEGTVIQPRSIFRGSQTAFIEGKFTITGGKGFNFPKSVKSYFQTKKVARNVERKIKALDYDKDVLVSSLESKFEPVSFKPKASEQVALTKQTPVFQVPFRTQAPKVEFQSFNFDVINAPVGSVKLVPLVPVSKSVESSPSQQIKSLNIFKPRITKPTYISDINTFQEVRPTNAFKVTSVIEQVQIQKPITEIKAGQRERPRTVTEPKSIIKQLQDKTQISSQIQTQKQISKQEGVFQNVFKKTPLTSTFQAPQSFKFQTPTIAGFPKLDFGRPQGVKGFNVFTRIKGVFKKANIKPLSEQDAINFGAYRVGTTSQATFKIGEADGLAQDVFRGKGKLEDFYKKDDLFIEKRGRRIKSIGELQEITFKGISSRKKVKSIFGGKK